jgi:hypothetical protein
VDVMLIVWVSCGNTVTDCVCSGAARYVALPAWSAVMVHAPGAVKVTVLPPVTLHVPCVAVLNVTVRPDEAVALIA